MTAPVSRQLAAEFIGTALLLATVVGSGVMGERLAGGNVAIALLANTIATGAVLYALISAFGSLSGAHFNPLVSIVAAFQGQLAWRSVGPHVLVQIAGALSGVVCAHLMFELPTIMYSQHIRAGISQMWSEVVATFGLLTVILSCARHKPETIPAAVATYITAAYWFTASTSFANPAVTIGRALTDTFSGIRPVDVPGFVGAQIVGASLALLFHRWMIRS